MLITTLTKRMAEQLTDYLADNGVKVRYLHSDIDTVERVEIIRDLRLGSFDVLVGINLLREGLDIPEVSLVAILDADKEGFLRAERSLIQTIGRAARNLNGKAILYADRMTDSMERAIGETERRRAKQIAFNAAHGITPRSVRKQVSEMIDGVVRRAGRPQEAEGTSRRGRRVEAMSEKDLGKRIKLLERQMLEHARNLEFEKAARVRDQLALLREQAFGACGRRPHRADPGARRVNDGAEASRADGVHGQHLPLADRRGRVAAQAARARARRAGRGRFGRHARLSTPASRRTSAPSGMRCGAATTCRRCGRGCVHDDDFERFDLILAMDWDNLELLAAQCPRRTTDKLGRLMQLRAATSTARVVPDPYTGGPAGFEQVLDLRRGRLRRPGSSISPAADES